MPVAGSIEFKIDTVKLTNQPSGIEEVFPDPVVHSLIGGGRIVSEAMQSANVAVTWGADAARKDAISELRTKRGTVGLHTIAYTDITGSTQTRTVYIPKIPYSQFLLAEAVDQITINFITVV